MGEMEGNRTVQETNKLLTFTMLDWRFKNLITAGKQIEQDKME